MSTLPFPFPPNEFVKWEPPSDGSRFTLPAPANSLTRYPTLRIQNGTRGTLYITNNLNSEPSPSLFDYRIGPYSSETITPDAQGVECYWQGVAGSLETIGFQWSSVVGAPGGAAIGEPYFPESQSASWFPASVGDQTYVGEFLSPVGGLAVSTVPLGPGQTIVACEIENRTLWRLLVRQNDGAGPIIGTVDPMSTTTFAVGSAQLFCSTDGPNKNRSEGQYVTFTAFNSFPKLDPAASYPTPGVHEPVGTMLQVSYSALISGFGATLFTVTAGKTFVLHHASLECLQASNASAVTEWGELRASQGLDGLGVAASLLSAGSFSGSGLTAGQQLVSRASIQGPVYIPSLTVPGANQIQVVKLGGSLVPCVFNVSVFGWYLPDTQ